MNLAVNRSTARISTLRRWIVLLRTVSSKFAVSACLARSELNAVHVGITYGIIVTETAVVICFNRADFHDNYADLRFSGSGCQWASSGNFVSVWCLNSHRTCCTLRHRHARDTEDHFNVMNVNVFQRTLASRLR